jgi:acetyl esterase/lipase
MQCLLLSVCALIAVGSARADAWQPPAGLTEVPIWPGRIPDPYPAPGPEVTTTRQDHLVGGRPWVWVEGVSRPTMTVYPPRGRNTGAALLVFPGGGYQGLAIDLEGTEVCDWLASRGITAVLLKYRAPTPKVGVAHASRQALEDAQRTLGLVRSHAADWHIDPHKIGVIGFSAGGYMVTQMSTLFDERAYAAVDAADEESRRPDFAIALYPGHLWYEGRPFALRPNVRVTAKAPPTFLLQAENDDVDNVNNSLVYYMALKNAGVPVEMHLYAEGGHAFGLRRTAYPVTAWPQLVETWLATIGMIPK